MSLSLLSDPFLQLPTATSVRVVWFTEFPGTRHLVYYGNHLEQTALATTTQLTKLREDANSHLQVPSDRLRFRPVWRQEAEIKQLTPGQRLPYYVRSENEAGESVASEVFHLSPTPTPGTPLKILLTSDHQLKPMTSANLQKVGETLDSIDAIFFAGDLANIPDRASEWFDDARGNAFFPNLQGRARYLMKTETETIYRGAALIQNAPLLCALGNHEVMGRYSTSAGLDEQFNDAYPIEAAIRLDPKQAQNERWLKDNSFNIDTYQEIFTLPQSSSGGCKYYAITFGDIRLVVLYITHIWRSPRIGDRGRYSEGEPDLNHPERWGYGQHIFEHITKGSEQYTWLEQELQSQEFQQARYKIAMFHHPVHSLGAEAVPAYTDPIQQQKKDPQGHLQSIRYHYPQAQNYLIRDLIPLLETAGVHLIHTGHCHLWNRFQSSSGLHFLETSNVGNSYGAYLQQKRPVPQDYPQDYPATGNPNGLSAIVPTIAPLNDELGNPLPYIASNEITVFSILEITDKATVSSYYFDTRLPDSNVIKFDEFTLQRHPS